MEISEVKQLLNDVPKDELVNDLAQVIMGFNSIAEKLGLNEGVDLLKISRMLAPVLSNPKTATEKLGIKPALTIVDKYATKLHNNG